MSQGGYNQINSANNVVTNVWNSLLNAWPPKHQVCSATTAIHHTVCLVGSDWHCATAALSLVVIPWYWYLQHVKVHTASGLYLRQYPLLGSVQGMVILPHAPKPQLLSMTSSILEVLLRPTNDLPRLLSVTPTQPHGVKPWVLSMTPFQSSKPAPPWWWLLHYQA